MRLVTKLMVLFLLLTTLPLAVVGYLAYEDGRRTIEQNTFNRLISTTIYKEAEFNRWVENNEQLLRALARRPSVQECGTLLDPADPEHQTTPRRILERHLIPALEEEGGFLDLSILRASDGLILISTDKSLEGKYRESEPFFVEGKNRTYVGNVVYCLSLGEAVMHISTPILDDDGNLTGVLAGHADLAEMSGIMAQSSGLSGSEETYLINDFNFFVTEPRFGEGYALNKAVHTEGVQACLAHNDGVGLYDNYRGVPVIGAYNWIPERELCILTEEEQAEAFAPIVALRNTALAIGASVALGAALLGIFFARTITGPQDQLVQGAEEIGRGNLEYRIEVASRDQIGQLAAAFNEMAAKRKWEEDLTRTQYDLGLALSTAHGLDEMLRLCLETAIQVSEMDCGGIYLADETSAFDLVSHQGLPPDFVESTSHFDAGSDQARLVMAGEPIYTEHLALGMELDEAERGENLRALAVVPVRYENHVIGCLNVASHIRDEVPNHARNAIEAITTQIGSSIVRTKAQEALRESEEKYRNLTESLDELIYRADPDTFVASYVNPAVEGIYGYTVKEWLADPTLWESTLHPDDQERVFAALTKARRNLEPDDIEYRILRKDKTVRWVKDHISWQKDQQGNVVSLNGALYDITERKEMQERLLRQEKLATLGQLAGGVGHELRNPLGVISNAIYFLQMTLADANETTREYLDIIFSEVRNSERIVSDLLDFARTRTPDREEITAADLVAQVLEKRPPPENVDVPTEIAADLPPVYVDPRQMGQVLSNLVVNAYQAMPDEGRLTIRAQAEEGQVAFSIADTGCGISQENMEKLFEPLFTTKARGIGLGLAVSKNLVEANGGSINVESDVGQGSTFTVRLPTREMKA